MPSFELVSVGCRSPFLPRDSTAFDLQFETKVISHRGLFQPVYDQIEGAILHLSNPGLNQQEFGFWASDLFEIEHDDDSFSTTATEGAVYPMSTKSVRLLITATTKEDLAPLIDECLAASPLGLVTIATDYQFGGPACVHTFDSLPEFWAQHDAKTLHFNTLFIVGAESKTRAKIAALGLEACELDAQKIARERTDSESPSD